MKFFLKPMRLSKYFLEAFSIFAITFLLPDCGESKQPPSHEDNHAANSAENFERGPHNGRLLRDGNFAAEIAIFERGVPPEFRVWFTKNNQPIDPAKVTLSVKLKRFAGVQDEHRFGIENDYLRSKAEVYEPHSFDAEVIAEYDGQRHRWAYESYEGRTRIDPAMATANGVVVQAVGPGKIAERISLYGTIQPDATRVRNVVARFPGVIRSVDVAVGDRVAIGQILARIESNESLQTYNVTAPIAGVVTQRNANPGESAGNEALLEIADYSQVWATLNVFPRDRARIQSQMRVNVHAADGNAQSEGKISAINADSNLGINARVVLDNNNHQWTPGQFVNADITVADSDIPLVVPSAAVQTFRDWSVVFLNVGDTYQAQPVELGKNDGEFVEITSGLSVGMNIVVANSYLVKADIEKSGASHDH